MSIKIAFTTNKGGLDDKVAERFGRAKTFTIVEIDNEGNILSIDVIENPGAEAASGAGIKAVQKLVDMGINIVVGPSPGPNAYMALQQAGIKLYILPGLEVRKALSKIIGELSK
ncbi:MAG: dinitrogenase iron-molybdenum cofactor biosynthesis protein [Thermoprotei archaeon]|nr:MAG: dinitrogenase iron-molybdenum cofactor biosynthesis protein [Thermoprotei archaeon]